MTYEVAFDVSQRIPQLGIGIVAAVALAIDFIVGLLDFDLLPPRWSIVFGLGALLLVLQWLVVGAWPYALAAIVFVSAVVVAARSNALRAASRRRLPPGTRRMVIGTFMLILVAGQGLPMVSAINLVRELGEGRAAVYEGPVTIEGFGKTECMTVSTYRYCYSEAVVTPGYNRMRYLFGALESGMLVRVSVIDDLIVRLEVSSTASTVIPRR